PRPAGRALVVRASRVPDLRYGPRPVRRAGGAGVCCTGPPADGRSRPRRRSRRPVRKRPSRESSVVASFSVSTNPGAQLWQVGRDDVADMGDETHEVGAENGRVGETISGPVAMCVKTATADAGYLTGSTAFRQGQCADLAGGDRGEEQQRVE